ncbi:MAG: shikimate kinase [Planctomycetota bacterium]
MPSQHLFLTGYRGSVKTTVAHSLADRWQLPAIDLDDCVESEAGRSIANIFETDGEAEFRRLESVALQTAVDADPQIIGLGGGAILAEENRRTIRDHGIVIWLDASPECLARRIGGDESTASRRPSLTGAPVLDEIASVMAKRRPLYEDVSDVRIVVDQLSVDDIVDFVAQRIRFDAAFVFISPSS